MPIRLHVPTNVSQVPRPHLWPRARLRGVYTGEIVYRGTFLFCQLTDLICGKDMARGSADITVGRSGGPQAVCGL